MSPFKFILPQKRFCGTKSNKASDIALTHSRTHAITHTKPYSNAYTHVDEFFQAVRTFVRHATHNCSAIVYYLPSTSDCGTGLLIKDGFGAGQCAEVPTRNSTASAVWHWKLLKLHSFAVFLWEVPKDRKEIINMSSLPNETKCIAALHTTHAHPTH